MGEAVLFGTKGRYAREVTVLSQVAKTGRKGPESDLSRLGVYNTAPPGEARPLPSA